MNWRNSMKKLLFLLIILPTYSFTMDQEPTSQDSLNRVMNDDLWYLFGQNDVRKRVWPHLSYWEFIGLENSSSDKLPSTESQPNSNPKKMLRSNEKLENSESDTNHDYDPLSDQSSDDSYSSSEPPAKRTRSTAIPWRIYSIRCPIDDCYYVKKQYEDLSHDSQRCHLNILRFLKYHLKTEHNKKWNTDKLKTFVKKHAIQINLEKIVAKEEEVTL